MKQLAYTLSILALSSLTLATAGCAGAKMSASAPSVNSNTTELTRSVFARDPNGQLSEEAIQKILSSPLELDLPARVGILPIIEAEDWRGPGPDYQVAPSAISNMAEKLHSEDAFSMVTEMMPIPSGALGMEALREIAARYKLRYIVLYRENVRKRVQVNPWAVGYATLIGTLFLPGSTLKVDGYVEASLFDVKTGLLMFTVRRRIQADRGSNVWYRDDKLDTLQARLANKVSGKLASDVRRALFQYARATRVENDRLAKNAPPANDNAPVEVANDNQPVAASETRDR
jgi:hypothetical protein